MLESSLVALAAIIMILIVAVMLRNGYGHEGLDDMPEPPRSALIINGLSLLPDREEAIAIRADGIDTVFRSVDEVAFTVETGRVRVYETVEDRDIADFGMVHIAGYPRPTAVLLSAIADHLQFRKVPAVNVTGIGPPTKLFQYVRLAHAGLPIPMTVYRSPKLLASSYEHLAEKLGLPFVLKAMSTSGGRFNYLISHEDELVQYLQRPTQTNRFLAQEFIPNDTTTRLLVLGGEVSVAMQRKSSETLYLTNTAQGGRATLLALDELDPVAIQLAVRAASLIGYDVAGVNLMQNWTTGRWYVLDVNSSPAIGAGEFVPQKLEAYSTYLKRKLTSSSHVDAIPVPRPMWWTEI